MVKKTPTTQAVSNEEMFHRGSQELTEPSEGLGEPGSEKATDIRKPPSQECQETALKQVVLGTVQSLEPHVC